MELIKRNIHMDSQKCKASMQTTLEKDINISDLKPDALKLIMDRGNVVIEEVRVTDDHVGVKGKLRFHILYLTEGAGTDVAAMEGEIPFEEQLYMAGVTGGDEVEVNAEIEDLTTTLINSRKFSVQSVILLKAVCEEIKDVETAVDITGDEPVEFRKRPLSIASVAMKKRDIFRVKEEVEIPGSFPNILSLIWWDIEPSEVEFKMLQDKISLQGEIRAFFIYKGEGDEEEICHYETAIPFAGTLDCDNAREGMIPEIDYLSEAGDVTVRPDFDGEERVFTFELALNLNICAYEEEQIDILSDVYGVVKEIRVEEKSAPFRQFLGRSSGKMKLAEHFKTEEGTQAAKILHTKGSLQIMDAALTDKGIEVTGAANLQILYENSGEGNRFCNIRVSLPFDYTMEAEGIDKNCVYPVKADVEQVSVSIIDADEIDVKCVLFLHTNVYREWTEKIVEKMDALELDSEKMDALPSLAIYVVREGESLWDIGKRYYVPISAIRQTNELTGDDVKAGDRILIMR
ncbi:MAG: SPOCS domain-containing protein [Suilimivivens sp.]